MSRKTILQEAIEKVLNVKSRVRYPSRYRRLWVLAARLSIIAYPESTFIMEEVRAWAEEKGLPDLSDNRAWGAIARALKADGHILETGETRRVTYANRSSQLVKVWKHIL